MDRPLDWLDPRVHRIGTTGERVAELATRITTVLPERVASILAAHPAQPSAAAYDADTVRTSAIPDPTATTAMRTLRGDPQTQALRDIERSLDLANRALNDVADRLVPYTPRRSTDYDRSMAGVPEPGCSSCARTESSKGTKRWEPIHRDSLCRWCYEWRRTTSALPTRKQLTDHHDGKRVRRPA